MGKIWRLRIGQGHEKTEPIVRFFHAELHFGTLCGIFLLFSKETKQHCKKFRFNERKATSVGEKYFPELNATQVF
jgi:hypothetical protein